MNDLAMYELAQGKVTQLHAEAAERHLAGSLKSARRAARAAARANCDDCTPQVTGRWQTLRVRLAR